MTLSKIALLCFMLILFGIATAGAAEGPYCAFEIMVHSADGTPSSVGIFAYQGSQRFKEIVTDTNGVARICDTPKSDPVEFQIGGEGGCGMVTVDARPQWLTTRRLSVEYENLCPETFFMKRQCYFKVRVVGFDGSPISGVRLFSKAKKSPEDGPSRTDVYGRLFRVVAEDGQLEGVLTKPGMIPAPLTLRCEDPNTHPKDRTIVLKRAQK